MRFKRARQRSTKLQTGKLIWELVLDIYYQLTKVFEYDTLANEQQQHKNKNYKLCHSADQ